MNYTPGLVGEEVVAQAKEAESTSYIPGLMDREVAAAYEAGRRAGFGQAVRLCKNVKRQALAGGIRFEPMPEATSARWEAFQSGIGACVDKLAATFEAFAFPKAPAFHALELRFRIVGLKKGLEICEQEMRSVANAEETLEDSNDEETPDLEEAFTDGRRFSTSECLKGIKERIEVLSTWMEKLK